MIARQTWNDESAYFFTLVTKVRDALRTRRMGVHLNEVRTTPMYERGDETHDCGMEDGEGQEETFDRHGQAVTQERLLEISARLEHFTPFRV